MSLRLRYGFYGRRMSPEQVSHECHDLDVLRAAFPAWALFCSDAGVFYATRRGVHLRDADIDKGLRQTVVANDAEVFVSLLQHQTRMEVGS